MTMRWSGNNDSQMMKNRFKDYYKRFIVWRMRHISDRGFLLALSVLVGLLSGLAAVLLKTLVHLTNRWLLQFNIPTFLGGNLLVLVYPAIGILLTIMFVRYVVKGNIGHGLPSVLLSLSRKNGVLPVRNMYSSMVASTLTVAFGGSVGLEAPIASTGSAIGSNVGRFFRMCAHDVKLLLGCGAAGAIAGIFKAPIAGVLFVIEVFMFDMTATSILPLMLSAISASTVAYFLMGNELQFAFTVVGTSGLSQIPYYVVLGVFCALVSLYFLRVTDRVESWFARLRQTPRAVVGAVALGGRGGLLVLRRPSAAGGQQQRKAEQQRHQAQMFFHRADLPSWSMRNAEFGIRNGKAKTVGALFYSSISLMLTATPPLSSTSTSAQVRRLPFPAVPGLTSCTPPICCCSA